MVYNKKERKEETFDKGEGELNQFSIREKKIKWIRFKVGAVKRGRKFGGIL